MKALGAEVELREGYVHAHAKRLRGTSFVEKVTVGGTENMMMAATLAGRKAKPSLRMWLKSQKLKSQNLLSKWEQEFQGMDKCYSYSRGRE